MTPDAPDVARHQRAAGYYWCRHLDIWEIARWRDFGPNSGWQRFGHQVIYADGVFDEIDECAIAERLRARGGP